MPTILSLGEALVDFVSVCQGANLVDTPGFYKRSGGGPANVAAGLAQLGVDVGFIGKVGADPFGKFLVKELEEAGVNTHGVSFTKKARTTAAFVALAEDGERNFVFYRCPGADQFLSPIDIGEEQIGSCQLLHVGSVSLSGQISREATRKAISIAKEEGCLVSMDPNIRFSLWDSDETAKEQILQILPQCDLLKLNQREAEYLAEENDALSAAKVLARRGPSLVVITLGARGSIFRSAKGSGRVEGYSVEVKDTTGAGDAFLAGFLATLAQKHLLGNLENLTQENLTTALKWGNAVAALTAMEFGATEGFPSCDEVKEFISEVDR